MKRSVFILSTAIATALFVTACGSSESVPDSNNASAANASASASASAAAKAQADAEARASAERREARAIYQRCRTKVSPLIESLQQVNSRLAVGLNLDEYGDRLGDAQVDYDGLAGVAKRLDATCIAEVAVPLEASLNEYSKVLNVWNDCIADYYCDFNEGEPNDKAQAGWLKAGKKIDSARNALGRLRP